MEGENRTIICVANTQPVPEYDGLPLEQVLVWQDVVAMYLNESAIRLRYAPSTSGQRGHQLFRP